MSSKRGDTQVHTGSTPIQLSMRMTNLFSSSDTTVTYASVADVFEHVQFSEEPISFNKRRPYRVVGAKGDLAYCALRKKSIQIQTFKGTWTLPFPDSMEEDPYMNRSCYSAFLVMLMYIADIRVSQTAAYPLRYRGDFQHVKFLDVPDARVIRNASDISNCLLDEI